MPRDVLGNLYNPSRPPRRVVSLVPSITETLFELGVGDSIVGITDFCIFPIDRVSALPRVGGTKNPDLAAIRALEPDLVYLNQEENLRPHGEAIAAFAPVFVTEPKTVTDVLALLHDLAAIHGVSSDPFTTAIEDELDSCRGMAPFTFAVAVWKKPWLWCGGDTYVSDLVSCAGGTNVLADRPRYPAVTLEELVALSPEILFLPDEPYLFSEGDRTDLRSKFNACIEGPFPGHLFTWHGTRTLLGLRFLRELLAGTQPRTGWA